MQLHDQSVLYIILKFMRQLDLMIIFYYTITTWEDESPIRVEQFFT